LTAAVWSASLPEEETVASSFNGTTAIVTGSGQGIGRAIALFLAQRGAAVVVNSRTAQSRDDTSTAADVADEIAAAGGRVKPVFADVGTMHGAAELVEAAVETFGSIDILVNNAGVYPSVRAEEMTEDTWDMVMNVNLKATYATAHYALPYMRARSGGRVINMISRAGLAGVPAMTAYSAAKAGVIGFTFALAKEVAGDGITVNCVSPSAATVRTQRTDAARRAATGQAEFPSAEQRSSAHIAPAVAYLASDAAGGVTGRIFFVEGGEMTLYDPPLPSRTVIKQGIWTGDELAGVCESAFGPTLLPPASYPSPP
jgi:NAD(P)-dependent dehydrogenase (short-subunit alcohol dehydrogenase family)